MDKIAPMPFTKKKKSNIPERKEHEKLNFVLFLLHLETLRIKSRDSQYQRKNKRLEDDSKGHIILTKCHFLTV